MHIITHLSKPIERTNTKNKLKADCVLGVLMMFRFISRNKGILGAGDVDNRGGYASVRVEGIGEISIYLPLTLAMNLQLL